MSSRADVPRRPPVFTQCQQSALARRYRLPLTTGHSTFVQLLYSSNQYYLALYEREEDARARFCAMLHEASIVNNITEKGPCLFLICKNGQFEFQTTDNETFTLWLQIFKDCGLPLIPFHDLYEIQKMIGEGSFAKVYKAIHKYTKQEVCVKAIDKSRLQSTNVYTEIELLRRVAHPYINRLFAAYEKENMIYLVLEYLRGGELFEYLAKNGCPNESTAKLIIRRILKALNCLHRQGIVHRDLKTENLILEEENNPATLKIIDLGFASTLGSPAMKMRCGSPGYVAPEIILEMAYGVKVDLFSAGVILYNILGGYPPFRGSTIKEILKFNVRAKVSFNHHRWGRVSQCAKHLILWMTTKDPDSRCSALQALNHPWFEGVPSSITAPGPKATVPARAAEAATATKKKPVPDIGSASTCAGSPGGNNPDTTASPTAAASATAAPAGSAAAAAAAAKPARLVSSQLPSVVSPALTPTTTPAAVRIVSSGVPTSPLEARGEASTITRPAAPTQTPEELVVMASTSTGDTRLVVGGTCKLWEIRNNVDSETAQASAGTPVYKRVQSRPLDEHSRPVLFPTAATATHSPAYARTRARAKTGASSRNAQSDMVQSAARAVAATGGDDISQPRPQRSQATSIVSVQAGDITSMKPTRAMSMHGMDEGQWGLQRVSKAEDDPPPVWSKTWFKTKDGKELDVLLAHLTASNPVLAAPLKSKGEGQCGRTWKQQDITSAYLKACRFSPSRASIMSIGRQPSSRLAGRVDLDKLETWEDSVRKMPTGTGKTVRFGVEEPSASKAEIAPQLRRFKSMPANPDPETGTTKERSPIVLEEERSQRSAARARRRTQTQANSQPYDPYSQPSPPAPSIQPAAAVNTTTPQPHQPPSTQTTSTRQSPFNLFRFRPRNSNADRTMVSAPPDYPGDVAAEVAVGITGPAPAVTAASNQPKKRWKVPTFKK